MENNGLEIRQGEGLSRVQLGCSHQKGLLYVVPAERSWVCSQEMMPAHALAGFLGELTELQQPAVQLLMNRWGISYRRLPLDIEVEEEPVPQPVLSPPAPAVPEVPGR